MVFCEGWVLTFLFIGLDGGGSIFVLFQVLVEPGEVLERSVDLLVADTLCAYYTIATLYPVFYFRFEVWLYLIAEACI